MHLINGVLGMVLLGCIMLMMVIGPGAYGVEPFDIAGAPFTVASYCIGTGKNLAATREFARENPKVFQGLMERLGHATVGFVNTLLSLGGDAWQLFDSQIVQSDFRTIRV